MRYTKLLFEEVSSDNDRMYALDWQHESFDFNAKKYTEIIKKNNEWFIPTFPNGDYYIFVTKDFKNVWFWHPWEQTITLIWEDFCRKWKDLISKFEKIHIFEIK